MIRLIREKIHLFYDWQIEVFKNLTRNNVVIAPRQHGKTTMVGELIKALVRFEGIAYPLINLCSDTAERLHRLYFREFHRIFGAHDDFNWPKSDPSKPIILKRQFGDYATINIFGSTQNFYGPKGTAPHANFADEFGRTQDGFFMESLLPSIHKTEGFNFLTGTVESNHYYRTFNHALRKMRSGSENWYAFYMKFGDKWSREVHNEESRKRILDDYDFTNPEDVVAFEKDMMCNWFAELTGNPFAKQISRIDSGNGIGAFPCQLNIPVGTCWDNGQRTAVWFWQFVFGVFRMVNYMEWVEEDYSKIFKDIRNFYEESGVRQGLHIFPHTMKERQQIAGNKQLWRLAKQAIDPHNTAPHPVINKKPQHLETKIKHTQSFLMRCVFNENTCYDGLMSLRRYRRSGNPKKKVYSSSMLKDNYSHGAEAFSELAWAEATGRLTDFDVDYTGGNTKRTEGFNLQKHILFPF